MPFIYTLIVTSLALLFTSLFFTFAKVSGLNFRVYITKYEDNMDNIIEKKKEILREITYKLTPAYFSWLNWMIVLSLIRYFYDQSGTTMFSVLYLIGSILVPVHFFTQIARLQVVVTNSPTANRVCQAIHGLWLGPVITATTEITKYASEQLYLMQANGVS